MLSVTKKEQEMRKALIIANMLFVSATVFGMDSKSIKTEGLSAISQSKSSSQISSIRDISQSENMTQMSLVKEKCRVLFETSQSLLKNNKMFSEDQKLFYGQLKFEDIWEEIERIFFSDLSEKNSSKNDSKSSDIKDVFSRLNQIFGKNSSESENMKIFFNGSRLESSFRQGINKLIRGDSFQQKAIESAAKRSAKLYYQDILGDSELGKFLRKTASREIDLGEYVKRSDRDASNSFNSIFKGIKCEYYDYDDLFVTLVHETGHSLDWYYRIRKMLGKPITKICETLHLFENRRFLLSTAILTRPSEQQGENVPTFFDSLLRSSTFRGSLYSQDSSAHRIRLRESYMDFINNAVMHELVKTFDKDQLGELLSKKNDTVIQELKELNIIEQFFDLLSEPQNILHKQSLCFKDIIREKKPLWDNLLDTLDSNGYEDLSCCLRDIDNGKRKLLAVSCIDGTEFFWFSGILPDMSEVEIPLPKLDGINWKEIKYIAYNKTWQFDRVIPSFLDEIRQGIDQNKKINTRNLDNHTEGKYNSFRLIKEKGYLDMLEKGESLPIEEIMQELTKQAEPLNLTKESVDEFLEFLKK